MRGCNKTKGADGLATRKNEREIQRHDTWMKEPSLRRNRRMHSDLMASDPFCTCHSCLFGIENNQIINSMAQWVAVPLGASWWGPELRLRVQGLVRTEKTAGEWGLLPLGAGGEHLAPLNLSAVGLKHLHQVVRC